MTEMKSPRVAISYSWTTQEYEQWVINLATELRKSGVDIVLDKWDLKEGDDANAFMEQMVTDENIDKVLILCDRKYAEKANKRSGGVGTETQIISAKIYNSVKQSKFVIAVSERDANGEAHLPAYYTSRIYIDLSDDETYIKNFEQLLRWIYNKPIHVKPELGKPPAFLTENKNISLGIDIVFRRAIDAVKNGKSYADGALTEYFEIFAENLERFRISEGSGEIYDIVEDNISIFIPYRNQFIDIIITLSQYNNSDVIGSRVKNFFEKLIPYMYPPKEVKSWREWDFDNFKFIIDELFLYTIAILIKNECFEALDLLINSEYFSLRLVEESKGRRDFSLFNNHLNSFDWINKHKSKTKWLSYKAHTLMTRCVGTPIDFYYLQQADFTLFLSDCNLVINDEYRFQCWSPNTLIYAKGNNNSFEIYMRAKSKKYFDKMKCILNVDTKEEIGSIMQGFQSQKLRCPQWDFNTVRPRCLSGYDELSSKP